MVEDEYLKLLGERIFFLRNAKGITQLELAERLHTRNTHIRRIERGQINPTIGTLLKISTELDVSISELVNID